MAQIGLPKVDWLADERGTTAFERRTNPRAKVSGQAMAVFSNPSGAGSLTYVSLLDARKAIEKAVWGMLPKNRLGRQMLKKLKVYSGSEHPHAAQKAKPFEITQVSQ